MMWLAKSTRPDLSYLLYILTKGMAQPTKCLLNLARRGLLYLKGTIELGLQYSTASPLMGYSDSDYAGDATS
eukprot:scaffold4367_cov229-Prasinococcus_capsulatus_cf.AAC.1